MNRALTAPLKWHGGKAYLADWIISNMPPRAKNPNAPAADDPGWLHYVEPYAGGLAVLLAQEPEGISEVVNDRNQELTNFWRVLAHRLQFHDFHRVLQAVPFSVPEYEQAEKSEEQLKSLFDGRIPGGVDRVRSAVRFFIRCRMSMSGRMDCFTPLTRNRTRRGMNAEASAWLGAIEGLPAVHARLQRVVVHGDDAVKVIRQQDGPRSLFYCDPPYLAETRTAAEVYEYEMTEADHATLLGCLSEIKGRFLLSGYRSELYDAMAKHHGWRCEEMPTDNKSAKGKKKQPRVECVWMNY